MSREECDRERLNVLIVVGNQGTLDVTDMAIVELWGIRADGTEHILEAILIEDSIPAGKQNEGIELQLSVPATEDYVDLVVRIDAAGVIEECNEDNNEAYWGASLCP